MSRVQARGPTTWLILLLSAAWAGAVVLSLLRWGQPTATGVLSLCLLSALNWFLRTSDAEASVYLSFSSIILLAAAVMVGPVGAAIVGVVVVLFQRDGSPLGVRWFNTVMSSLLGILAGEVYLLVGGARLLSQLSGAGPIFGDLFTPLMVANVAMSIANVLLVAVIVRVSHGVPVQLTVRQLGQRTVPIYLGYGAIAFLLVLLWRPVGFGPVSILLIVPPLLGARWAYLQYAEERRAYRRALDAMVAAIELKAPHLAGHGGRVAALAGLMAEDLGLSPQELSDVSTAAMLHDVGLITLPTTLVRDIGSGAPVSSQLSRLYSAYPARSLELLGGLSFLGGALEPIARHRDVWSDSDQGPAREAPGLLALIVGVADEFDLLTRVGLGGQPLLSRDEALVELAGRIRSQDERIITALHDALERLDRDATVIV